MYKCVWNKIMLHKFSGLFIFYQFKDDAKNLFSKILISLLVKNHVFQNLESAMVFIWETVFEEKPG